MGLGSGFGAVPGVIPAFPRDCLLQRGLGLIWGGCHNSLLRTERTEAFSSFYGRLRVISSCNGVLWGFLKLFPLLLSVGTYKRWLLPGELCASLSVNCLLSKD